jgi:cell division transport system permease protein
MNQLLTSIKRTPYQSLAGFSVLFFTLFLSIFVIVTLSFLYGLLGYVETRPQVTVYFRSETSDGDIFKIRDELTNSDKVSSVKYVSKNEAFKIYKELNKDNPLLLEMVSADILPASLEIYAKKPSYLPEIAKALENKTGVDEVDFQKIIIERLISLTNTIRICSLFFFIFLIFNALITLLSLGHFKIALKKDEIELNKLLGASDFYIQKPFIQEGLFFGIVSSLTAFGIFAGILFYLQPFISSYMKGVNNLTLNFDFIKLTVWPINPLFLSAVLGITMIFGIVISSISSLLATKKYLK